MRRTVKLDPYIGLHLFGSQACKHLPAAARNPQSSSCPEEKGIFREQLSASEPIELQNISSWRGATSMKFNSWFHAESA